MSTRIVKSVPPEGQEILATDIFGNTVIRSRIGAPLNERSDFEYALKRVSRVGLHGWERAHSQGQGTGHESRHGITYAPRDVNQRLQAKGVELTIANFYKEICDPEFIKKFVLPGDTITLILMTVTETHKIIERGLVKDTHKLKEIQYVVEAHSQIKNSFTVLFDVCIEGDGNAKTPNYFPSVDLMRSEKFRSSDGFLYGV